jgi:hypothetical protein
MSLQRIGGALAARRRNAQPEVAVFRFARSAVIALFLSVPLVASAFPVADSWSNESQPALAHDTTHDRSLAVWQSNGHIYGRFLGADGAPAAPIFSIFNASSSPDDGRSYSEPAVTYKAGADRWYIAVTRTNSRYIHNVGTISGPGGIEVVAIDAAGLRVGFSRILRTPGVSVAKSEGRPTIAADPFATCCVAVAWEDTTFTNIFLQRLDENAAPSDAIQTFAATGVAMYNPAIVYEPQTDKFVLAFEGRAGSAFDEIRVARIGAEFGAPGTQRVIGARTTREARSPHPIAEPALAFNPQFTEFLVAWRDSGTVRAAFVNRELTSHSATFNVRPPCSGFTCFSFSAVDAPAVAAVEGSARYVVLVNESNIFAPANIVPNAYGVSRAGATTDVRWLASLATAAEGPSSQVNAQYSPLLRRVFALWQRQTGSADIESRTLDVR